MKTKMMRNVYVTLLVMFFTGSMFAQVGINSDGASADNSAMLDVKSTNMGFLAPRMTKSERDAVSTPATGLIIFNTTSRTLNIFNGTYWTNLDGSPADIWKCGQPITDSRNGRTYNTVLIGTQCWMAQNLNIGDKINGSVEQTNNSIIEKYCYGNFESNCNVYGGLYRWAEMVQYLNGASNTTSWSPVPTGNIQGICQTGWHLPTDAEWHTLIFSLDVNAQLIDETESESAGGKMKETGTTHWQSPNTGATNSSGFTALPGGHCHLEEGSYFSYFTTYAMFWSASENSATSAWERLQIFDGVYVARYIRPKEAGYSVRCLKD